MIHMYIKGDPSWLRCQQSLKVAFVEWFRINSYHICLFCGELLPHINHVTWMPEPIVLCGKQASHEITWNIAFLNNDFTENAFAIKVHEPRGTYLPLKWEPFPPECSQKRDPISPCFYWHCNKQSLKHRQTDTSYITVSESLWLWFQEHSGPREAGGQSASVWY